MREIQIKISDVIIPDNFRACYPKPTKLAKKRLEYNKTKIIQPLTVLEDDNKLVLINGYTNYLLAKEKHIKKVTCKVVCADEADTVIEKASRDESNNWKKKRRDIYNKHPQCYICGRTTNFKSEKEVVHDPLAFTLDHIMPLTKGGLTEENNLITCCKSCNNMKGEMRLTEELQNVIINELKFRGELEEDCVIPDITKYVKISNSIPYYQRKNNE